MMRNLFFLLLLVVLTVKMNAQSVEGTIKDIQNETVGGATVKLLSKDSSLLQTKLTDAAGRFRFTDLLKGNYFISVTSAGMKKYSSNMLMMNGVPLKLPVIIIVPAKTTELTGVTIMAKKPLIEQDLDKTIVNVEAMISAAGSNTLEVLEKTPGITVDNNGNISLNGKSGVLVLIDGRSTYMSGADLAGYLKSMPGAVLDKIELMDNPPSKYDAAGNAVINIRLKKNKYRGFTGNISSSFSQGKWPRFYEALNVNYIKKKINVFGNLSYSNDRSYSNDYNNRQFFSASGDLQSTIVLQNNFTNKAKAVSARAGMDYTLSPKTIIGLQLNAQKRVRNDAAGFESMTLPSSQENTGTTKAEYDWNSTGVNINFNHKLNEKGKEWSGDVNYIRYNNEGQPMNRNDSAGTLNRYFNYDLKSGIDIYSFKMDYTLPLPGSLLLEAGIKSSFVTNDNDSKYIDLAGSAPVQSFPRSNHFIYEEHIHAAYINLRRNWKRWGGQFGLRGEHTTADGNLLVNPAVTGNRFHKNFTDVFPALFVNYKLDSINKNSLGLNFATRIIRPNYQQLNPFLAYRDKFSYTQGNPSLQPFYMSRVQLKFQHKQFLSVTLSYATAKNLSLQSSETKGDSIIFRPVNIAKGIQWLLSANLTLHPAGWWTAVINAQPAYFKLYGSTNTVSVDQQITAAKLSVMNQFNFSKGWSAELSAFYSTKDIPEQQVVVRPRYRVWTAMQKKIWKDKGSLRFSIEDIFHSWVQKDRSFGVQQSEFYHCNENDSQRFGLSFSYRFGSDQFARKRKQNESAAETEKGRVE